MCSDKKSKSNLKSGVFAIFFGCVINLSYLCRQFVKHVMQEYTIDELIPQRPPFVMVDRLLHCGTTDALTELVVREDNIFVDGDELSAAGVMENMAQSCAARIGYISRTRAAEEAATKSEAEVTAGETIGVIGDIRECVFLRLPHPGETLRTHIQVIEQMMNLTLAELTTSVGEETIATARMKIALADRLS